MNIWNTLPKPFFALAPMEDVTDTVFRQIVGRCGKPDIYFTEFTSVEAMVSRGRKNVTHRLRFGPSERPIIAQIWGNNRQHYYEAIKLIKEMNFDGVDINMGCPVNKVVSRGYCAGLIRNPSLAQEIVIAAKEAAGDMPVSIKTRIGYDRTQTEEWTGLLLQTKPAAITLHARTAAEMSRFPLAGRKSGRRLGYETP